MQNIIQNLLFICEKIIETYQEKYINAIKQQIIVDRIYSRSTSNKNQIEEITVNKNISEIDCRISLFKSQQKNEFFLELLQRLPQLTVYLNVALSSLFDFNAIKNALSSEQREYFLKATVDCVVFDPRDYKPIYFFELDSSYHDTPEQITKDDYKNRIFDLAGQILYRIRKNNKSFKQLIDEILEQKHS